MKLKKVGMLAQLLLSLLLLATAGLIAQELEEVGTGNCCCDTSCGNCSSGACPPASGGGCGSGSWCCSGGGTGRCK